MGIPTISFNNLLYLQSIWVLHEQKTTGITMLTSLGVMVFITATAYLGATISFSCKTSNETGKELSSFALKIISAKVSQYHYSRWLVYHDFTAFIKKCGDCQWLYDRDEMEKGSFFYHDRGCARDGYHLRYLYSRAPPLLDSSTSSAPLCVGFATYSYRSFGYRDIYSMIVLYYYQAARILWDQYYSGALDLSRIRNYHKRERSQKGCIGTDGLNKISISMAILFAKL